MTVFSDLSHSELEALIIGSLVFGGSCFICCLRYCLC